MLSTTERTNREELALARSRVRAARESYVAAVEAGRQVAIRQQLTGQRRGDGFMVTAGDVSGEFVAAVRWDLYDGSRDSVVLAPLVPRPVDARVLLLGDD